MKTKEKNDKVNSTGTDSDSSEKDFLEGYPISPSAEDIYSKFLEEKEINPENTSENKESYRKNASIARSGKDNNKRSSIDDLDIPGSELDDMAEDIGSEDEENNYYSLGGDKNSFLEEDQGE